MTQQTSVTVDKFYQRIGAGDIGGVIDLLSDDIHWDIPGDIETVAWLPVCVGRASNQTEL